MQDALIRNKLKNNFSKYENSTAMFCYTSFLASTNARPSIAIKYSILITYIAIEGQVLVEAKRDVILKKNNSAKKLKTKEYVHIMKMEVSDSQS